MNATKYPTRSALLAMADTMNVEVFYRDGRDARECRKYGDDMARAGWHYWCCFPGCLPEGDAIGPFTSATAALRDAYDAGWLDDGEECEA